MSLTFSSARDSEDALPGTTPLKGKAIKVATSYICNNFTSRQ